MFKYYKETFMCTPPKACGDKIYTASDSFVSIS